jgi:hypothetical protein
MSLHALTEDTAWHEQPLAEDATSTERAYEGRVICDCGYIGPWRGGETLAMHALLRIDYREHAEAALGADAYYSAPVACRNCGSEHEQPVLIGTYADSAPCARCGTRMLEPNNDAWHESREQSKRWFG